MHYIRRIRDFTKSTSAKDLTSSPDRNGILSLNAHWFSKPQGVKRRERESDQQITICAHIRNASICLGILYTPQSTVLEQTNNFTVSWQVDNCQDKNENFALLIKVFKFSRQ